MEVAYTFASRSTCLRLQVGCVFSLDGRILVTGYNGAPAHMAHCTPETCNADNPCLNTQHAEANAIAFAARHGVRLEGSTLHVTNTPCRSCALSIINIGVEKVLYAEFYRDATGLNLIKEAMILTEYFNHKKR